MTSQKAPILWKPCVHHKMSLLVFRKFCDFTFIPHCVVSLAFLFLYAYSRKCQDLKLIYHTVSYTETERDLFACKGMMPQSKHPWAWGWEV